MGRPLNKRYFGATSSNIASSPPGDLSNEEKLTAIVKVGANSVSETGIILSQRSETKFKVDDAADGSGNEGVCTLVDKDVPGNDEMVLKGYIAGDGDGVNIRKVQNRTMFDFNNNRYTWAIEDDSTSNVLVLTAI